MCIIVRGVYVDYNQCVRVVGYLKDFFKSNSNVAKIEYPSNILYKSNEYFIYMFYSCLLDYGMRSAIYHKNLSTTYKNYSFIFNPKYVLNMDDESLKNIIINNIHPRYPNVAVNKWRELSKKLFEYDSILDYLKGINSFDELDSFIKNIKGYGQKTGGLLIRIICDTGVCNFNNDVCSIPIDRHDIEISYLTGIINSKNVSSKDIDDLSGAYVRASRKLEISPSDVDKYLWEIGNSFCNKKACMDCPLSKCCRKLICR